MALDGVTQSPKYHPEGDALTHSLQVFDHAHRRHPDPRLWLAALVHDVGKALDGPAHDALGATLLDGLVAPPIVTLVRHHLDLLKAPAQTRRRWRHVPLLRALEALRRFDLAGRVVGASTRTPAEALDLLRPHLSLLSPDAAHDAAFCDAPDPRLG